MSRVTGIEGKECQVSTFDIKDVETWYLINREKSVGGIS